MASVSGKAVASSAIVLAAVVTTACLAVPATALVPYGPWDLLDDPFRVRAVASGALRTKAG
jgi:hypothetical protein